MNKHILLFSLLSLMSFLPMSKADSKHFPEQDLMEFKIECVRNQVKKLITEFKTDEDINKFLKQKKLDKYFGIAERKKVKEICANLGIQDKWLYAVIWFESRGNPKAVNPYSQATGLIQFMPRTASKLGTSVSDLSTMTVIEQLNYVEIYLKKWDDKYNLDSFLDTYLAVFYPAALGQSESFIIGSGKVVEQNKHVDKDNDGILTVKDFTQYIS